MSSVIFGHGRVPGARRHPLFIFCHEAGLIRSLTESFLIISPWNYPFQLAVAPLIGAIAAGNCALIKPSEFSPSTSQTIANLVGELFEADYIAVFQGEAHATQKLLEEKFDYIFFTGSTAVGRSIMNAAARHLTPVTLELGGKSPCIVHEDASLKYGMKRIVWGKFSMPATGR